MNTLRDNSRLENRLLLLALILILIFVSPYFLLGEDAHMRVHDNLDSNIAWYKVLKESGKVNGSVTSTIPQIMNGELSRNAFGSEWSGIVWLHLLFPSVFAYGLSQLITRLFAFFGMYLLLKDHFLSDSKWNILRVGVSLTFSLTPFWPSGMLCTLGMPLALWALLNIRNGRDRWTSWLTLTLIPLYANIVLGFFFFISAMGVFWLVDVIRGKGLNLRFLGAIVYLSLIFFIVDYRLVYSFLFENEPNSRDEYFHARLTFVHALKLSLKNYVLGHNHVMTVHGLVILPISILALYLVIYQKRWRTEKAFVFFHILNIALSAWYAFWFYKGWLPLTKKFHFLDTFNFARYHFLRPMIIYVLFGLSLKILWEQSRFWKRISVAAMILQLLVLVSFNEEIIFQNKPSFKEFYAVKQFKEIEDYIGQPKDSYRVASIGIHPAISQYNGFYTIDSYNNFYPLSYKHQFRKIIEKELDKNNKIREYFDEWGGRCYIFTAELGKHYMFKKNSKKKIKNLELNTVAFQELGGTHIFSAVPIENASENHLQLEKIFNSTESAWKIYLYRVVIE